jgi:outer membrane protein TolC
LFLAALYLATATGAAATVEHPPADDPFAGSERLDRDALVRAVLARNQDVEAMRQAWLAARERPAQAGALADPMVSYGVAPLSIGSADVDLGQELRVEQPLPYPGRRGLRRAQAEAEAGMAGAELAEVRLELTATAALLFADYALVHQALAINTDHRRLLGEVREVAAARYAAGLLSQQDPLLAETEEAELQVEETELAAERAALTARINALLHRASDLPLPPPEEGALAARPELPEVAALEEAALAARPEIAARLADLEARRAALDLARLERRPDFGVMTSYNSMWGDREHRWMAGMTVNLPVWRRRTEAARREAEARLAQAEAERTHIEHEVRGEVREAHARLAAGMRAAILYESRLLPAARDQVEAARAGFTTGQVTALAVLEAERAVRRAELGYAETLAALERRRAELDRATGRLPAGPDAALLDPTDNVAPGAAPARASQGDSR